MPLAEMRFSGASQSRRIHVLQKTWRAMPVLALCLALALLSLPQLQPSAYAQTVTAWNLQVSVQDTLTLNLAAYQQLHACTPSNSCAQSWQLCNMASGKPVLTSCLNLIRNNNNLALLITQSPIAPAVSPPTTQTQVATMTVQMPSQ